MTTGGLKRIASARPKVDFVRRLQRTSRESIHARNDALHARGGGRGARPGFAGLDGSDLRRDVIDRVRRTTENIALSSGATAETKVVPEQYVPSIYNDPKLVARMLSTLRRVAGPNHLIEIAPLPFPDDFAFYQEKIPGLFVVLGARAPGDQFIPNHSPKFHIDEASLLVGERTLAHLTLDYMLGV
jgi:hypothetical protein